MAICSTPHSCLLGRPKTDNILKTAGVQTLLFYWKCRLNLDSLTEMHLVWQLSRRSRVDQAARDGGRVHPLTEKVKVVAMAAAPGSDGNGQLQMVQVCQSVDRTV